MVTEFGMSDSVGPRTITQRGESYAELISNEPGSILKQKINSEVDKILDAQY